MQRTKRQRYNTTDEWILFAKDKHNNKYDYSKVNYINCNTKVTIICKKHGEFTQVPSVHLRGNECQTCSYEKKYKICEGTSFASHEKSKYWSSKNVEQPEKIAKFSHKKYYFDCDCGHEIIQRINSIQNDQWCPFCSDPPQKLCDDDNCAHCFNNSFASQNQSKYWSKNNNTIPRNVFKKSGKKYIFDCPDCNKEYRAALRFVTLGNWCTCTKNKTEQKLFDHLELNYEYKITKRKTIDGCESERPLPFDFCIEELKLIIELDGPQHFVQIWNWRDPLSEQKNDKYKMKCANDKGYSVIRLLQDDIWNDKNNWKDNLKNSIKKYNEPINIFFGNCYDNHKNIDEVIDEINNNISESDDEVNKVIEYVTKNRVKLIKPIVTSDTKKVAKDSAKINVAKKPVVKSDNRRVVKVVPAKIVVKTTSKNKIISEKISS